MGLFNLFGNSESTRKGADNISKWVSLISPEQLDSLAQNSISKPQIIYKHSTTCGISSMVFRSFESNHALLPEKADLYFLTIQQNRQLSNEIAQRFNVRHESPQLLVIKNGVLVLHASHSAIPHVGLEKYL